MAKHAKVAVDSVGARVKRTFLAVATTSLVVLGVLPTVIEVVVDELGAHMPDGLRLWLLGAAVVVTAVATAVTRIMAIPAVNGWLTSIGFGSQPKSSIDPNKLF